ncbi:uncharacterized protein TRAVEDRAFT_106147, partial [Trametes versicolor FP-101664 SS1]|uniref:uncharacterized protein n=1 Tax=Trametes versicolor (strain FP-101664) TaxID=717944 RepID=UPI0004622F2A
ISGLQGLVELFPFDKRPSFADAHDVPLYFPFRAFANRSDFTIADIIVSLPGKVLDGGVSWRDIAMVIETKCSDAEDPFSKLSPKPEPDVNKSQPGVQKQKPVTKRSAQQLAKNARNILLAHGALAAFVIGIYGHTVRLARFDRTCALVSVPFRLDSDKGATRLQEFFWRFTHPLVGNTIAGCDPTVMALDDFSKEWIKQELRKARVLHWQKHTTHISEGRRIEVYDERSRVCMPYLLYNMVSVSKGLFSRATTVWRAIEDTRIWKNGQLVPDPSRTAPVKPQIVKEAWRSLGTRSEIEFYQRLNDTISCKDRYGLAS